MAQYFAIYHLETLFILNNIWSSESKYIRTFRSVVWTVAWIFLMDFQSKSSTMLQDIALYEVRSENYLAKTLGLRSLWYRMETASSICWGLEKASSKESKTSKDTLSNSGCEKEVILCEESTRVSSQAGPWWREECPRWEWTWEILLHFLAKFSWWWK